MFKFNLHFFDSSFEVSSFALNLVLNFALTLGHLGLQPRVLLLDFKQAAFEVHVSGDFIIISLLTDY